MIEIDIYSALKWLFAAFTVLMILVRDPFDGKRREPASQPTKVWPKKLDPCWFQLVRSGRKTVEGRLVLKEEWFSKDVGHMVAGDYVKWTRGDVATPRNTLDHKCWTPIREKVVYSNFQDMLQSEGLGNVLPDVESLEEGVRIYEEIYREQLESGKPYVVAALRLGKS